MVEKLAEILRRGDFSQAVRSCWLSSLWNEIIDERMRKNTESIKVRNRVLYISTSSSTWAQELSLLKAEIIRKFNERAGEEAIRDVRFKSNLGGF